MSFVKERNFIVCYDGAIKMGAWNITNGHWIGKSGKEVTGVPHCFRYDNLRAYDNSESDFLGSVINFYRDNFHNNFYGMNLGQRFEQLISLKIIPNRVSDLYDETPLTKDVVKYINETCHGVYRTHMIKDFITKNKYNALLDGKPEWYKTIFVSLIQNYPYEYLKTMLNRCLTEKVNWFWGEYFSISSMTSIIQEYYDCCMTLYNEVKVMPNVLSNLAHLKALREEYKNAHYNEILQKNNDMPWLYFEDNNFIVRPILSREAFHYEGEAQHNCVERLYMEKVFNNSTYIVTVRRKSEPDKAYITCEVTKDHKINQYYAACNHYPSEDGMAIAFKKKYELF